MLVQDVYNIVGVPQLDSMFDGYNGCIFAYGQTSSGKSHSMMGYEGKGRGVSPRMCEEMFARIEEVCSCVGGSGSRRLPETLLRALTPTPCGTELNSVCGILLFGRSNVSL